MDKYIPTDYIKNHGNLDPMRGFGTLIRSAFDKGLIVTVDFDEGEELTVTSQNARYAAHEADMAWFAFYDGDKRLGSILVMPNNGGEDDWLADYPWIVSWRKHCALEDYLTFPSY